MRRNHVTIGLRKLHRLRSPNCRSLTVVVPETRDGEIANGMVKFKGTKTHIFLGLNVVDWKFGKEAIRRLDGVSSKGCVTPILSSESYLFQSKVHRH